MAKKPYYITTAIAYTSGKPHIGNTYEIVLADSIARFKRMQGYEALWVPGTDHASISTEVKVTNALKEEGIDKHELGREGFLKRTWEWKKEYGETITSQLKKIGSSCDWDRERFKWMMAVLRRFLKYSASYMKKVLYTRAQEL